MKEILENSALFYYSDLILVFTSFVSTIITYIYAKNNHSLKNLFLYPLFSTINSLFNYYILYFLQSISVENLQIGILISNIFFSLFEFLFLSHFLILLTKSKRNKKFSVAIQLLYLLIVVLGTQLIYINDFIEYLYIINSFLLAPISFLCLFDCIINNTDGNLSKTGGFWLTSGVNIYFIGTIPIFLSKQIIFHDSFYISETKIYSINYIAYSILFIFVVITSKCNTQEAL